MLAGAPSPCTGCLATTVGVVPPTGDLPPSRRTVLGRAGTAADGVRPCSCPLSSVTAAVAGQPDNDDEVDVGWTIASDGLDLRRIATRGRLAIVACRAPHNVGLTAVDGLQRVTVAAVNVVINDDPETAEDDDGVATLSNPPEPGDAADVIGNITTVVGVPGDVRTLTCNWVVDVCKVDAAVQMLNDVPAQADEPFCS